MATYEKKKTWQELFVEYKQDITDDDINYILWNETCYPFDDKITVEQIDQHFKKNKKN